MSVCVCLHVCECKYECACVFLRGGSHFQRDLMHRLLSGRIVANVIASV